MREIIALLPPSATFDTGLLSLFQRRIVGWCNPRRITKGFPFHMGPAQQAGGRGSVELSRGGNLFSRGGDPQFLSPSQGLFCWEASQAQVKMGTILTWDSTQHDPRGFPQRGGRRGRKYGRGSGSIIPTRETLEKPSSDPSQNTFNVHN